MTGTDRAVLEREAKRLAQAYWDAREDFVFGCETGSVAECVARAIASPTAPVVLAESATTRPAAASEIEPTSWPS